MPEVHFPGPEGRLEGRYHPDDEKDAPIALILIVIIWGLTIVPDSAQFSALVADASPPEKAGSLMTFQTA